MSYLFFMDESGHDHRNTPYEVRGGVAISSLTRKRSPIQKRRQSA
jgi:hypothetical protein